MTVSFGHPGPPLNVDIKDKIVSDKYKSAVNDNGVYKNGVPELKEHHTSKSRDNYYTGIYRVM